MLLEIRNRLHFLYDDFVRESQIDLRVEPANTPYQTVQVFHLAVGPPAAVDRYRDWNGNAVHHLGIRDFHDRIEVEARSVVAVESDRPTLDSLGSQPVESPSELLDFVMLEGPVRGGSRLDELARSIPAAPGAPLADQVAAIGTLVREHLRYEPGVTSWRSSAENALEEGAGVCQDFAHVMLGLLRRRGIPCRYVSGFLHLGTAELAQSHAWLDVYAGGNWVGFDPTHDRSPNELYVRVAHGRHYDDVPPNRGIFRGNATESLEANVETREVQPQDVAGLRRSTPEIQVPVYTELPALARRQDRGVEEQPEGAEQQQQQQ